jgi:hypothetical protein
LVPEESNQLGVPFCCFFSSLLFSSLFHIVLLHWISAQYKWRWHGYLPPPDHSHVEVEFPFVQDPPKFNPEWNPLVAGLIIS